MTYHVNRFVSVKWVVVVKYMWQAMSLFGRESQKHPFKGYWHIPRTNETVWCPKLYDFEKDGLIWKNSITENDQKIIMKKEKNGEFVEVPEALNRAIVFAHQKNLLGQVEYRFYGVFEPSDKESGVALIIPMQTGEDRSICLSPAKRENVTKRLRLLWNYQSY